MGSWDTPAQYDMMTLSTLRYEQGRLCCWYCAKLIGSLSKAQKRAHGDHYSSGNGNGCRVFVLPVLL